MAIRNLRYDRDPILRKKSKQVEKVDERIKNIVKDMFDTMYKYDGVGLSAPQIGILRRIIVVDTREKDEKFAIINPEIEKVEGKKEYTEGCLSFPDVYGTVERPKKAIIRGLDENGKSIRIKAEDILAEAILHEIDHLNGILFIDMVKKGSLEKQIGDDDFISIDDNTYFGV